MHQVARAIIFTALIVGLASASPVTGAPGHAAGRSGGAILFSSDRDSQHDAYYVVNADGSGLKQVLSSAYKAVWSPDGRWLAFSVGVWPVPPGTYLMDAGGTKKRVSGAACTDLSWSPDGRRIVCEGKTMAIFDVVEGKTVKTFRYRGSHPRWSPDGRWIAFVIRDELWVTAPNGSRPAQLSAGDVPSDPSMSWAPDGKRLAFLREDLGNDYYQTSVFVAGVEGTDARRLARDAVRVAWSPRGDLIAITARLGLDKGKNLYLVRPDGTRLRKVFADVGIGELVWAPDGRTLAVSKDGDVWVLDARSGRGRRVTQGWRYGYYNWPLQWNPARISTARLPGTPVSWAIPSDSVAEPGLLKTRGAIEYLVADGSTVATAIDHPPIGWCLETWDPESGALTRFRWRFCRRPTYCCSLGAGGLGDLAFAGGRAAWVFFRHFAGRDLMDLVATTPQTPRPMPVSFCDSGCLFDVEGKDGLVVFDMWTQSCATPSYPSPCALAPRKNDKLFRLDGTRAVQIGSSPGALAPLAVDAGRILVDHQDGTLKLLGSDGSSLGIVRYEPGNLRGAKLQGRDVVVLTQGTIEHYDAGTGERLHEWPLAAGDARLEDVQSGIAVYVSGDYVYLVRLSDGATVALPSRGAKPLAQLEEPGLFYAYRTEDASYPGRVAFIPFDELPLP